jgi:hypothetical protein
MAYTKTTWANGDSATATKLNNLETQYDQAIASFNREMFTTGFVVTGLTPSGTVGTTTVNIASGTGVIVQSDSSTKRIAMTATTKTTSALSTTYYLYLQPDGTYYWSTTNSPAANSIAIATVTTNGSGQISAVTDARNLAPILLPNLAGTLGLPTIGQIGTQAASGSFGAPVIAGVAVRQHISATGTTSILIFDADETGLYRVSLYFLPRGVGAPVVTATYAYSDPDTGSGYFQYFAGLNSAGSALLVLNAASCTAGVSIQPFPVMVPCMSGSSISINYTRSGSSPNDYVSAIVERLA